MGGWKNKQILRNFLYVNLKFCMVFDKCRNQLFVYESIGRP